MASFVSKVKSAVGRRKDPSARAAKAERAARRAEAERLRLEHRRKGVHSGGG